MRFYEFLEKCPLVVNFWRFVQVYSVEVVIVSCDKELNVKAYSVCTECGEAFLGSTKTCDDCSSYVDRSKFQKNSSMKSTLDVREAKAKPSKRDRMRYRPDKYVTPKNVNTKQLKEQ